MNDSGYEVVFNILDKGCQAWVGPVAVVLLLISCCFLPLLFKRGILPKANGKVMFLLIGTFTLISLNAFVTLHKYLTYREAFISGRTSYVEGMVEDFVSLPKRESFSVKGVRFSYSDDIITEAFNNMSSHGGPIRPGLYVRIWYIENAILKLEVRK